MKTKVITVFLVVLVPFSLLGTETDFSSFSFFGFMMSFNQAEVEEALTELGKDYSVRAEQYGSVTIVPPDQMLSEQQNLDFQIGIYNDQVMGMSFYGRDNSLLQLLSQTIAAEPLEKIAENGSPIKEWTVGEITVRCWILEKRNQLTYEIFNNRVRSQYWDNVAVEMGDDPFY